jgi:hypothetical protein
MAKSFGVVRRVSTHRGLGALVAIGAAFMLVAPVTAQSADESASPGPADGSDTAGDGVRAGWMLHTSDEPAFSIQLPPGWAIDPSADGLFGATGPDGETLVVSLDESATGVPLGTYTERSWGAVEKDVEALLADGREVAGGTPTEPVYRQAAGGPVARHGVARSEDQVSDGSHVTARFLTAPCEDGARTLEITGPAPQPGTDQGPDAWDSIAASISPCSSEPMPELVLGPEVAALRAAYLAVGEEVNPRLFAAVDELFSGGSFKKWAKDSRAVADVYDEFVRLLPGLPWTAETLPLSEAQTAKFGEMAAFYRTRLAKATTNREIDRLIKQVERLDASLLPATAAVRLAIGLSAATTSLDVGDPVE